MRLSRTVERWGSYCQNGDRDTGSHTTRSFLARAAVSFYVAGYPGTTNLPVFAENIATGKRLPLKANPPHEHWELETFSIPAAWYGQSVRLIAEDRRTSGFGWQALSDPGPLSVLDAVLVVRLTDTVATLLFLSLALLLIGALLARQNRLAVWSVCTLLTLIASSYAVVYMLLLHSGTGIWITSLLLATSVAVLFLLVYKCREALDRALHLAIPAVSFTAAAITVAVSIAFLYGELSYGLALSVLVVLMGVIRFVPYQRKTVWWLRAGLVALVLLVWACCATTPGAQLPSVAPVRIASLLFAACGILSFTISAILRLSLRPRVLASVAGWLFAAAAFATMIFKWQPLPELSQWSDVNTWIFIIPACAIAYGVYRIEIRNLGSWRMSAGLAFLILVLTAAVNNVHYNMVDLASNYFPYWSNLTWQTIMQDAVMNGTAAVLPHTYRFLPNALVRWLQLAGIPFAAGRDLYRIAAGMLLNYALYRYARQYTGYLGGLLTLLLVSAVYPVSFEHYAGQLTDPLSHLSFVLALIFLETADFPLLLMTLCVGSLAKETVLAFMGYYVLFCYRQKGYLYKAPALCLSGIAAYFGVRIFVLHGDMHYTQISGVGLQHVAENWLTYPAWLPVFLLTGCIYLALLILGWRSIPISLKRQSLYLLPVLFFSSLLFSWLAESRNYMPAAFVLAAAASVWLVKVCHSTEPLVVSQTGGTAETIGEYHV